MTTTTTANYENDLAAAENLIDQFVDSEQCGGNGANWINDALNNSWVEGIAISEWVARAVVKIPASFRRSSN